MDECFVSVDPLDVEAVLGVDPFLKDAESRGRAILSAMKADFSVLFSSSSFWGLINDLRHPDSLMYKKEEEVDFEASDRFVELLTAFWEIRYGRLLKILTSDFPGFSKDFNPSLDSIFSSLFALDEKWMGSGALLKLHESLCVQMENAFECSSRVIYNEKWGKPVLKMDSFRIVRRQLLENCVRAKQPLSKAFIDLDKFKRINDRFGHAAGDYVLRTFLDILIPKLRSSDALGSLGGEEFGVLLPFTDKQGSIVAMDKIRKEVEAHTFIIPAVFSSTGEEIVLDGREGFERITVSIGVETVDLVDSCPTSDDVERYFNLLGSELSVNSDLAMNAAKHLPRTLDGGIVVGDFSGGLSRNHVFHYQDILPYRGFIEYLSKEASRKREAS